MSKIVDERVVEMRFDNQHFEKNVSTTMSTLDKLKEKLNFKGASKGLEDINHTSKKIDMAGLGRGVEAVSMKFSALQVAGITALTNLTNSAVNAGKRMVNALTIQPITTGFSEYELKMGSIQTIMASTGESLDTVNRYLGELNEYSDKTIYSFSDMTQNIGKFTNAGVKLEDAVLAIKGISNEAALSGANANEAARAMYNFSQALSAGFVKLIDWKSIELANMATVGFKEELIKTAVEVGTLTERADGLYDVTEVVSNAAASVLGPTKNFNDSLANQWMTTEVLTKTLARYADETTDIGKRATQAATEVKTFSMMMDALKESAQSGWAQTWELIFGDFNEGKTLWTSINNVVGGILDKMSDTRNSVLTKALTSNWDKLSEHITKAGISTELFEATLSDVLKENGQDVEKLVDEYESLTGALRKGKVMVTYVIDAIRRLIGTEKDVAEVTDAVTMSAEELNEVANKVINGFFGHGEKRMQALTEAGYDYATVQNKVNEILGSSVRHVSELTVEQQEQMETLSRLTDEQLKNKGYTEDQIASLRELQKIAETADGSIASLATTMSKPSGRMLLLESFKNIWEEIQKIFESVGKAWSESFGDVDMGESLYNLISYFHEFSSTLDINSENLANFEAVLSGVFSASKFGTKIIGKSLLSALKLLDAVFDLFGTDMLAVAGKIGEAIHQFEQWFNSKNMFGWNQYDHLAKLFAALYLGIKDCVKAFIDLDRVQSVLTSFRDLLVGVFNDGSITGAIDKISPDALAAKITEIFETIEARIKSFNESENLILDVFKAIGDGITYVAGSALGLVKNLGTGLLNLISAITGLDVGWILVGWNGLIDLLTTVGRCVKNLIQLIWGLEPVKQTLVSIRDTFVESMTAIKNALSGGTGISDFVKSVETAFAKINAWVLGENVVSGIAEGIGGGIQMVIEAISNIAVAIINTFKKLLDINSPSKVMITLGGFILAGLIVGLTDQNGALGASVRDIGTILIDGIGAIASSVMSSLKDLKIGDIIAVGLSSGLIYGLKKLSDSLSLFGSPLKSMTEMFDAVKGLFKTLNNAASEWAKAQKYNAIGKMVRNIALALAILVGAVAAMCYIIVKLGADWTVLVNAVGVITVLAGVLYGLAKACTMLNESMKFGKDGVQFGLQSASIVGIALSLMLVAAAIKLLSSIKVEDVEKTLWMLLGAVVAMGSLMLGVYAITSSLPPGTEIKGLGKIFTKLAWSLIIMIGVIKLASMLEPGEAVGGIIIVGIITLFYKAVLGMIRSIDPGSAKYIKQFGKLATKLAWALVIMIGVIKLASMLSAGEVLRGLGVITAIGALFLGFMYVNKLINSDGKNAGKMGAGLFRMALALLICTAAIKLIGGMKVGEILKGVFVVYALGILFIGLIEVTQSAGQHAAKAGAMLIEMSVALLILTAVLYLIRGLDAKGLAKGLAVVTWIAGIYAGLIYITKFAQNADKVKGMLITLTIAIGVLAIAIVALSLLDTKKVLGAAGALTAVIGVFALLIYATSFLKSGKKTFGRNLATIIVLGLLVAAFAFIIYKLSVLEPQKAMGAATALGTLLLALSGALWILGNSKSITKAKITNMMLTLVLLSMLLFVLGGSIQALSAMSPQNAISSATALGILLLALAKSFDIISHSKNISKKNMTNMLGTLTVMTLLLFLLAGSILVLEGVNPINAIGSAIALGILLLALSKSFDIITKSDSITASKLPGVLKTVGLLALVALGMGLVIEYMKDCNPLNSIGNAVAIGLLLGMLAAAYDTIAKSGSITKTKLPGVIETVLLLGIVTAAMAVVISLMDGCNPLNSIGNAIALSILVTVLVLLMKPLATVGLMAKEATKGALALTALVIPLLAFGFAIASLPAITNEQIKAVIVLSLVMAAMTLLLKPLMAIGTTIGATGGAAALGIVALIGMFAPLIIFGEYLSSLKPINNGQIQTILALVGVMTAMTLLLFPLSVIGFLIVPAALGIVTLSSMMNKMCKFADKLMELPNLTSSIVKINIMMSVMQRLTDMLVAVSSLGVDAAIGVLSINGMVNIVKSFGVFATALGWLMEKCPTLETFLDKGMEILISVSEGLGTALGAFVSAFAGGIADAIVSVGKSLTAFTLYALPFFALLKMVDEESITGVKNLVKAILALTAADFIQGLTDLNPFADGDFASLGTGLMDFVRAVLPALALLNVIEPTTVESLKTLCESVKLLTSADLIGGIAGWLGQKLNFVDFGEQMKLYGQGLSAFYAAITENGTIDTGAVEAAKAAGELMVELQSKIEPMKGVIQAFVGEKDLGYFGEQLETYGTCLSGFCDTIAGNTNINSDSVQAAKDIGLMMTELQSAIEPTKGLWQMLAGTTDLETFGGQLEAFGTSVKAMSDSLTADGGVSSDAVDAANRTGQLMLVLMKALPEDKWFDGVMSLSDFGAHVATFGSYINIFSNHVKNIDVAKVDASVSAAQSLGLIAKTATEINSKDVDKFDAVVDIGTAIKEYYTEISGVDTTKLDGSISAYKQLVQLIKNLVGLDTSGVGSFKSAVESLAGTNISALATQFTNAAANLKVVGSNIMDSFAKGVESKKFACAETGYAVVEYMASSMGLRHLAFTKVGSDLIDYFNKAIEGKKPSVERVCRNLAQAGATAIRTKYTSFYSAGSYLVTGFVNGISGNIDRAAKKAVDMASTAVEAAKGELGIESPSKVFKQIGKYVPEGFAIGISSFGSSIKRASIGMADTAIDSVKRAITKVADVVNSDIDTQPTIRPVLDLSDVKSGVSAIDGLFGTNPSVGVLANVGSISSMMNSNQNGGNADIISAINKLRGDLSNIGGNSYSINGITYDDGSNVSEAIKTLVRATKIERRI